MALVVPFENQKKFHSNNKRINIIGVIMDWVTFKLFVLFMKWIIRKSFTWWKFIEIHFCNKYEFKHKNIKWIPICVACSEPAKYVTNTRMTWCDIMLVSCWRRAQARWLTKPIRFFTFAFMVFNVVDLRRIVKCDRMKREKKKKTHHLTISVRLKIPFRKARNLFGMCALGHVETFSPMVCMMFEYVSLYVVHTQTEETKASSTSAIHKYARTLEASSSTHTRTHTYTGKPAPCGAGARANRHVCVQHFSHIFPL